MQLSLLFKLKSKYLLSNRYKGAQRAGARTIRKIRSNRCALRAARDFQPKVENSSLEIQTNREMSQKSLARSAQKK